MTKKELEDKISKLEKQLVKLKEELEKQDDKMCVGEIWKPKKDEKYYFNSFNGDTISFCNELSNIDYELIDVGNCYPIKEKSNFEAKREKYTRLFRQYVEQHSEPLDWNSNVQSKYCVFYNYKEQKIKYLECYGYSFLSCIYASSKEVLQDAIDFVGEEIVKKYILEIGK